MELLTKQKNFSLISMDPETMSNHFAEDVKTGLTGTPKSLMSKYLYDEEGSRLFEEICTLEEYYLTRAEREILQSQAANISAKFSESISLVELGSGNAEKTRLLIEAFLGQFDELCYVPVDISRTILEESSLRLQEDFEGLEIKALWATYWQGLKHLNAEPDHPRLFLFLGSNIGNFEKEEAVDFLQSVCNIMSAQDRLLVGIDLRKNKEVLEAAYDDSRGVTAKFNLNILTRINRELGGNFKREGFRHRAVYNEGIGRIETYLVSRFPQTVHIEGLDLRIRFGARETIHTENSYKYSFSEIDQLARDANLRVEERWLDGEGRFSLNLFAKDELDS